MAIPKFEEFLIVILEILSDGKEHNIKEIKERSVENFNLTDEEIKELLSSGTQSIVNNIVGEELISKSWINRKQKKRHF